MDLRQHLKLIGHSPELFAFKAKLPVQVLHNGLAGRPVSAAHAEKIAAQISKEHNMPHNAGLDHEHIDGLSVVHPDELKGNLL